MYSISALKKVIKGSAVARQHAKDKSRDWWDKAPVIISAFSSVVLAATGLYISASFQKAQLLITQQNNNAQVQIAREKNTADIRLEELKSATDLMEPLLSSDERKRLIAIVMLPHSISDQAMSRQILFIATSDASPKVRLAALTQMAQSDHKTVAAQLEELSRDTARPANERALASTGAVSVSLRASAPTNSAIFFASQPGALAFDSTELSGGVFTYALLKGIQSSLKTGSQTVTVGDLRAYLSSQVPVLSEKLTGQPSSPWVEATARGSDPILAAGVRGHESALVVGVGTYTSNSAPPLAFANSDAEKVSSLLQQWGVRVYMLRDPQRATFIQTLRNTLSELHPGDRFLFYYSGHGLMVNGENVLLMSDSSVESPQSVMATGVTASDIKASVDGHELAISAWFLDVCQTSPFVTR